MQLSRVILAVASLGICSAQLGNGTTPVVDFSTLPSCGLVCLATTAPKSGCSLTDFDCICKSQKMTDLSTTCILANCTVADAFTLVRAQANICQYGNESRSQEIHTVSLIFGSLTKAVVALRITLRMVSQGNLFWDDWLILLAVASDSTAFYALLRLITRGFGEHIWNINPANVTDILFWFYIVLIFYVVTNGIVKLSILAFYLRIFAVSRRFTILCWINVVFCTALMICFVFVIVFQCTPVSNAWALAPQGFCIDFNAATWAYSAVNVFQDLVVIILPVMEVYALQLSLRKKIGVIMIFVLGGFVIIASAVRLFTLPGFGRTSDPTWTNGPTTMWSSIELGVGLVCASIPGIYSGLRSVWPDFRQFTRKHISLRGSEPTNETADSRDGRLGISGIRRKGNWKHPNNSMDLLSAESHEMESGNSMDQFAVDKKDPMFWLPLDLNKPHPPLPREAYIEASTTITIIRGPASP